MDNIDVVALVAGHPVLDLINTVDRDPDDPTVTSDDALRKPSDVLTFAVRAGVLTAAEARGAVATTATLRALRELREAAHVVARCALGDVGPRDPRVVAALAALDRSRRAAERRRALVPSAGRSGPLTLRATAAGPTLLLDRVALSAVDLLTSSRVERLRRCPIEDGGCGWLFLDGTKNRSRRWCRMDDCGTRVKSRRLTERRRAQRTRVTS